jgi:hypothetical protein
MTLDPMFDPGKVSQKQLSLIGQSVVFQLMSQSVIGSPSSLADMSKSSLKRSVYTQRSLNEKPDLWPYRRQTRFPPLG